MSLLTYRLIKLERSLVFQVIHMDESQRATSNERIQIFDPCSAVASYARPSIEWKESIGILHVYVRGMRHEDDYVPYVCNFKNNDLRDTLFVRIQSTLAAWGNSGGFNYCKPKDTNLTDIFTV